jgi:prepilin-type N-terminal cleavage/methylation domain-containing protein
MSGLPDNVRCLRLASPNCPRLARGIVTFRATALARPRTSNAPGLPGGSLRSTLAASVGLPRTSLGHRGSLRKLRRPHALTLVELLVVLTILAILTTVAVVSTETVLSQGRFEATQRTLQAIEEAVLGHTVVRADDGSAAAGFVADIGRLPTEDLTELWQNPLGLPPYRFQQADAAEVGADLEDLEVFVPCGWRGPYVRLPAGGVELLDGWGNPLDWIVDFDGSGDPQTAAVRSRGADGLVGSTPDDPYSGELGIVFLSDNPPLDRYRATIRVTVWQRSEEGELEVPTGTGSEHLFIRLFSPTNGSVGVVVNEPGIPLTPALSVPPAVEFLEVPIGPHVLRAYVQPDATPGSEPSRKSLPLEIQVHPQRSLNWRMILPAPTS